MDCATFPFVGPPNRETRLYHNLTLTLILILTLALTLIQTLTQSEGKWWNVFNWL